MQKREIKKTIEMEIAQQKPSDTFEFEKYLEKLVKQKDRGIANIFYSHSLKKYGKKEEKRELVQIRKFFSTLDYYIINPNPSISEFPLLNFDIKNRSDFQKKMSLFKDAVNECSVVVFTEVRSTSNKRYIGKGVYLEIEYAFKNEIPVILFREHLSQKDPSTDKETYFYTFYPISPENVDLSIVDEYDFVYYARIAPLRELTRVKSIKELEQKIYEDVKNNIDDLREKWGIAWIKLVMTFLNINTQVN